MLIDLLILTIFICYIIDLSGFIYSLKSLIINHILKIKCKPEDLRIKPFDCSLCMTFWSCLIFTIVNNQFTFVNLLYIVLLSFFSSNISSLLQLLKDALSTLQYYIYKKIQS